MRLAKIITFALASSALLAPTALHAQDFYTPVPQALLDSVGDVLPESSNAGAAFVSDSYSPNLTFTEQATVSIVFIWEGAGYRNSLGWFTYQDELDGSVTILSSDLLMPDASFPSVGSSLTGDSYDLKNPDGSLRIFQPGERVGFFVVADGWNREDLIKDWDPTATIIPSNDPLVNAGFGRGCYTSINKLNPEYAQAAVEESRHLAMLWMPAQQGFLGGESFLVSGFEDLLRTGSSDDDFNDLVFVVTATPIQALEETQAFVYAEGDPDGDGVSGIADSYPNDPTRASLTRYPAFGQNVVGFEDQYPSAGDADFNDVLLAYDTDVISNAQGLVTDISMTLHLVARGAGYEHSVGLHLPGLPDHAQGTLRIERFLSDDESTVQQTAPRSVASLILSDQRRIADVFPSTYAALPPLAGATFTNTQSTSMERPAASSRVLLNFDTPLDPALLGPPPYDLFIGVVHGDESWDVHLPGWDGFADRPASLPIESGSNSFLDPNGMPWALQVPTDWLFPLEQVRIWNAYPSFNAWVASNGIQASHWYLSSEAQTGLVSDPLAGFFPNHAWSVELPQP